MGITLALCGLSPGTLCRSAGKFYGLAWLAAPPSETRCRRRRDSGLPAAQPSDSTFSPQSLSGNCGYGLHVVVQDRLQAPAVPFQSNAGPAGVSDGALVVFVVAPADAGTGFQESGLSACHFSAGRLRSSRRFTLSTGGRDGQSGHFQLHDRSSAVLGSFLEGHFQFEHPDVGFNASAGMLLSTFSIFWAPNGSFPACLKTTDRWRRPAASRNSPQE